MKERAKKFKKILEFTKSKGYSKESAEILFKLWNYIILPNEEDKLVSSLASFDEFMAGLKEADEIFTELNFKEVEKIRYFFILTGKKGEEYYNSISPLPVFKVLTNNINQLAEIALEREKKEKRKFFYKNFF
ncbi:hypothetical protein [Fusobacterium ulcerans]|uniref:Uncharacterized protein n=1 Tax=Fusobacterium ulcerans 12-1B TaxID=457404 RepID=H1PQK0_9FUSO|nr:hypothetical protein [Fusobacterium ulcerans]EHO83675.1 hypothetical protein HMPREF0402_00693 [Fusobacterium ulcerans 12-1B]